MPNKGLNVDTSVTLEEGIAAYDSLEDEVMAIIEEEGIPLPRRPVDANGKPTDVVLPPNFEELDNVALEMLIGQIDTMLGYLLGKLSYYRGVLDRVKRKKNLIYKKVLQEKVGSSDDKKVQTEVDRRFIGADRQEALLTEVVDLIRAAKEAKEKDAAAVSRLISLRIEAAKRDTRIHGLGNRRRGR